MNKIITVDDICNARDIRIKKLQRLSINKADGFILFTLNIPGEIKNTFLYGKIFNQGIRTLKTVFKKIGIVYKIEHILELPTGPEAYMVLYSCDLIKIKKITAEIEEDHPLGRIFDIDLFDRNLNQVKINRDVRKCYICERSGIECSRSKRHNLNEVLERIKAVAENYFDSLYWKVASTAIRAMVTEVIATPKPGLVDSANSGSHSDMDIFSFIDSSTTLTQTFYMMVELGGSFTEDKISYLLTPLREIGLAGEEIMYHATGGVNTQKGLIFSLGILSAAAGYLLCNSKDILTVEMLCKKGGEIATGIVKKDFKSEYRIRNEKKTNGEKLFSKYGITGARGEAENGFKSALKALEILQSHISKGCDFNQALLGTLIHILVYAEDTNILGRNGIDALEYVKLRARVFIDHGGVYADNWFEQLKGMDKDFINKNISPGGSADILVVTLFLYFLKKTFTEKW